MCDRLKFCRISLKSKKKYITKQNEKHYNESSGCTTKAGDLRIKWIVECGSSSACRYSGPMKH